MYYIDIGNSYAKILNEKDELITIETNKIIEWLNANLDKDIVICSVALEANNKIKKLYSNVQILDNKIYDKLFEIDDALLYKKGSDRLVTGYGAIKKYQEDIIVVDMGTCVTVDVYVEGKYKSGYIYPGMEILRTALNKRVKQLPIAVETFSKSNDIIDTNDQIFWGNIYGMIGAINQFVKLEKENNKKDFKVILTGGTIKDFNRFLKEKKLEELFEFKYIIDSRLIFDSMKEIIKVI